jgi:aspartyl-tRNA(Asn)/glutamyl-tRNA(Gln) amidotransferase subunit A
VQQDLLQVNLAEVAALIRQKQVSPYELTEQCLARISTLNPTLNAFITITGDAALAAARQAEGEITKGDYRGPLHGIPVAVKDLIYTAGVRTTCGSKILANFVPDFDATVIKKLQDAGAISVGKTAMHEFAYGITNENPHYGPTRNPWNPQHVSGGSSGGSAVSAATGMCFAAVGTDTGGSIRIPGSFCGTAGLKPTFGRISCHGAYPLGPTLDHVGPMARTVVDVGILYQLLAGYDLDDGYSADHPVGEISLKKSLQGMRVGIPDAYFEKDVQPEVLHAFQSAATVLEELGAQVSSARLPDMARVTEVSRNALLVEGYAGHWQHLAERPQDLGPDVKANIEKGKDIPARDYVQGQLERNRFRIAMEKVFDSVDVLITPATPLTAFPIGTKNVLLGPQEEDARTAATRFTRCFNATGHPALTVCCGFDSAGLPVGLQIVGRFWDEATVLQAGFAYEQATDWHNRLPPQVS